MGKYRLAKNLIRSYGKRAAQGALGLAIGTAGYKYLTSGKPKKKKQRVRIHGRLKFNLHQRASAIPGQGGTFSKFFYGKRKIPKGYRSIIKGLAKNYQTYNGTARYTAAVGVQDIQNPLSMFGQADVQALLTNFAVSYKDSRALLMSCSAELMITNQDVGNARITLYDVVCRRDCNYTNNSSPSNAWLHSYADQGATNTVYIGATPFSAELFTQFYKVVKITHIVLGQGQCHTHRVHYAPNKVIDGEYVQYDGYGFKGLTCFTMLVDHGMPYNDSTTKTSVSTGNTALDVVWRKQYKYTYLTDNSNNYYVTNSLPASFAVNEDVMNIGSGTVVVDVNA